MDQATQSFAALILRTENLLTMVAVWVVIGVTAKMFPKLSESSFAARLQPLAPILLCVAAVWIPGLQPPDMKIGSRIMMGIVLGFGVGHVHKIIKQTGFGDDERIERKRARRRNTKTIVVPPPPPSASNP